MTSVTGLQVPTGIMGTYATIGQRRPVDLYKTLLRHPTLSGLDVLAHLATAGRATTDQILRLVSETRHAPSRSMQVLEPLDHHWLGRLATALALMDARSNDRSHALALLDYLKESRGLSALQHEDLWVLAQLSLLAGRTDLARSVQGDHRLTEEFRTALTADLANPYLWGRDDGDEAAWLGHMSRLMLLEGGDELSLTDVGTPVPPFDRLEVRRAPRAVDGPLTSVIVPAYEPDRGLLTAVRSVLAQSWRNLECVIVDDGSSAASGEWLERAVALDDRVRLVRLERNVGTYGARNAGLDAAAGDFIAFQDADDWSHPRRLEHQLEPMIDDPSLLCTTSRCIRVDDQLMLAEMRRAVLRHNESSLCFRREEVMHRIGYFDPVRKGADSEYRRRIMAVFDQPESLIDGWLPLAVIRRTTGSLSRSEFRSGWRHRARFAYRANYERWHDEIRAGADPYVARGERPTRLPAPIRMLTAGGARPRLELDAVVCADWRDGVPNDHVHAMAAGEARALAAAGLRVGLAHVQPLSNMSPRDDFLGESFHALLTSETATEVLLDDLATVGSVLLHEPSWLQFLPVQRPTWDVSELTIVAHAAPHEERRGQLRYLVDECNRHAVELFGVQPSWVPTTATIHRRLGRNGDVEVASSLHHPSHPCGDPNVTEPRRSIGNAPVVGRWACEPIPTFPGDAAGLQQAYGAGAGTPLIVGGRRTITEVLGAPPPHEWTVLPAGGMRYEELLARIDVLVHLNDPRADEDLDWLVLVAAERGVPAVLPYRYRPRLGPLATYASPEEVPDLIASLGSDSARRDHFEAAREHARDTWGRRPWLPALARTVTMSEGNTSDIVQSTAPGPLVAGQAP